MLPNCDQCGKPFAVDARALNKRFCSKECRMEWHAAERQRSATAAKEIAETLREFAKQPLLHPLMRRQIEEMVEKLTKEQTK